MFANSTPAPKQMYVWLAVLITAFVAAKIPALSLPLFWDEAGVYGAAGLYMHDHTLSMMPESLPPVLSRGHPLLYTFLQAIGFHVFGDTVFGGHLFNLLIAVALLWSVWYIVNRIFHWRTAFIAVMMLAIQPIFFAQSVMILPEVMLTLWMLWALYFWYARAWFAYALCATLAILTKETAIILPLVVLLHTLLPVHSVKRSVHLRAIFASIIPWVIFGVFLLVQHAQQGWYLFPYHGDLVKMDIHRFITFAIQYLEHIFWSQGRWGLSALSIVALVVLIKQRKLRVHAFSALLLLWCAAGVGFNSLAFYMDRYILFVVCGGVILFAVLFDQMIRVYRKWLVCIPLGIMTGALYLNGNVFQNPQPNIGKEAYFTYDVDMRYASYVQHMRQFIQSTIDNTEDIPVVYANFPINVALHEPRFGYTRKVVNRDFYVVRQMEAKVMLGNTGLRATSGALIADPGSYDYTIPTNGSWIPDLTIGDAYHSFVRYVPVQAGLEGN